MRSSRGTMRPLASRATSVPSRIASMSCASLSSGCGLSPASAKSTRRPMQPCASSARTATSPDAAKVRSRPKYAPKRRHCRCSLGSHSSSVEMRLSPRRPAAAAPAGYVRPAPRAGATAVADGAAGAPAGRPAASMGQTVLMAVATTVERMERMESALALISVNSMRLKSGMSLTSHVSTQAAV